MKKKLSHLVDDKVSMVDISLKNYTKRIAKAEAKVIFSV